MLTEDERRINMTETTGDPEELKYIRQIVADHDWRFAKTYADFCPHEYTLRKNWRDRMEYAKLVNFIWRYGFIAQYGNTEPKRYWFDHETGYYYFIYDEDTDENGNATEKAYLINRAKISDYNFWIDNMPEGVIVRCWAKPKR